MDFLFAPSPAVAGCLQHGMVKALPGGGYVLTAGMHPLILVILRGEIRVCRPGGMQFVPTGFDGCDQRAPGDRVHRDGNRPLASVAPPAAEPRPSPARAADGARGADAPREPPPKPAADPFALPPSDVVEPLPVPAFLHLVLSGLFSSGSGEEAMPVLRRWDRASSDTLLHVVAQRTTDCDDTLAGFRHAVLRPFDETAQKPPLHLAEAEKKIADHCAKLASQHLPGRPR